eukprot:COSAG02_NODE_3347_length_6896_cov_2.201854_5_plen_126_part_00
MPCILVLVGRRVLRPRLLLESCVTRKLDEKRRFFDQSDVEPAAGLGKHCRSKDRGNCNHICTRTVSSTVILARPECSHNELRHCTAGRSVVTQFVPAPRAAQLQPGHSQVRAHTRKHKLKHTMNG